MNTLEKQDIQQLKQIIDSVKVTNENDVVLMVNSKLLLKVLKEKLPGVRVICTNFLNADDDDKVYIIPYKEINPIRIIYEGERQ